MKLAISAFALASLASSALAGGGGGYGNGKKCLSQSQAETLVNEYSAIIAQQPSDLGGPVRTARAIIAPGYTETSDSANMQLGIPASLLYTCLMKQVVTNMTTAWSRHRPIQAGFHPKLSEQPAGRLRYYRHPRCRMQQDCMAMDPNGFRKWPIPGQGFPPLLR